MITPDLHVVLLSGGSGTRLWPLSNGARSKQFLKVLRTDEGAPESMVQRTVRLVRSKNPGALITVATSAEQLEALSLQVEGVSVSLEPERRDTAPAIMLAAANIAWEQGASANAIVVVLPIDTYAEPAYYSSISRLAATVEEGEADLVLLGVEPTYPSEKFGYIVPVRGVQTQMANDPEAARRTGSAPIASSQSAEDQAAGPQHLNSSNANVMPVERFVEKPAAALATQLIEQGALWNCGVFAFRLGHLLDIVSSYTDAKSYEELRTRYRELPRNSFDYEVVERARSIAALSYAGTWKDLGTWNSLCEELAEPTSGAVWLDAATTTNVHAINETGLPLVVAGIEDAVVAATPDGILVTGKDASAHIKALVEEAAADRPMYERRRWGEYRVIDEGDYADGSHTLTKELVLLPGCQLSYQRHARRAEVWTIADGKGEVVVDGEVIPVSVGDSVSIRAGRMHAARANTTLHIIEVQVGWPLVEEDIERFGNFWE